MKLLHITACLILLGACSGMGSDNAAGLERSPCACKDKPQLINHADA